MASTDALIAALPVLSAADGGAFTLVLTLLAGLGMLGVLVVVHEFGHFLVAKLFRIGVPVFSVGMGPKVASFWWRGTEYRLSALPVGGYVRMAGADPFGEEDPDAVVDPDDDFMQKPVWQRLLVMLAGPGFNLALPFVLFTGVLMLGEPQADGVIGSVRYGSPADVAGVQVGDRLVAIDGAPVDLWVDAVQHLSGPRDATVTFARDGKPYTVPFRADQMVGPVGMDVGVYGALGFSSLHLSTRVGVDDPTAPAYRAGLRTGDAIREVDGQAVGDWESLRAALSGPTHRVAYWRVTEGAVQALEAELVADPTWSPRAGEALPDPFGLLPVSLFAGGTAGGSAAEAAGLQADDRLLSVDGTPVRSWEDLVLLIGATVDPRSEAAPRAVDVQLVRDGQVLHRSFAPKITRSVELGQVVYRPVLGIKRYPDAYVEGPKVPRYYGPIEAFSRAVQETWFLVTGTLGMLANLVTGELRVQETIGGPIEIFRVAQAGAERGIFTYVRTIGAISISLGIFNLLPVPVLDGGQILFFAVEALRGRPLSIQLREKLQMAGVLAMVGLMLVVMVFDVNRWLTAE